MKKKAEQRKAARHECGVLVEGKEGSAFEDIRTVDIGQGGVGLISSQSIPVNEKIVVQLDLNPEEDPILIMGEVRWVAKAKEGEFFRVGMSFCDEVYSGSRSRLKKYFKSDSRD